MPRRASPRSPRPASSREHRAVIYEVSHRTRYRYSAPISISHHVLHLAPRTCEHQRCHAKRPRGHACARLLGRRYRLFRQSGDPPDRAGIAHRAVVPQPEPGRGERRSAAAAGHDRAVGGRGGSSSPATGRQTVSPSSSSPSPRPTRARAAISPATPRPRSHRAARCSMPPAISPAASAATSATSRAPPRYRPRSTRYSPSAAGSARTSRTSRSQRCARSASRCATSAATW